MSVSTDNLDELRDQVLQMRVEKDSSNGDVCSTAWPLVQELAELAHLSGVEEDILEAVLSQGEYIFTLLILNQVIKKPFVLVFPN